MQKKNHRIALLAIIAAAFIGSSNGIAVKIAVRELDPLFTTFLRCIVAFVLIFPLFIRENKYFDSNTTKVVMLSLLSVVHILLFAYGIVYTTVIEAGILYTLSPVLALITSYFLLKEPITKGKILSIVLGLIGAVIIILSPFSGEATILKGSIVGNSIIFLAVFVLTLYAVLSRNLVNRYSPIYLITYFVGLAVILTGAVQFNTLSASIQNISKVSSATIIAIFISGIATIGFYVFYQYAIKLGSPLIATMNQYIQPACTFILGSLLLGETLSLDAVIGAPLVFTAAYLATYYSKSPALSPAE